ncbi:MAG TPA: acyl carrier protein [Bacteroidota bacterium]|nr:acyl carrier protein [Bacteroidota bacterium]
MEERVRKVFSAVFQIPASSVNDSSGRESVSGWDSLKHLTLVLALEEEFGVRFEDDEAPALESFSSIVAVLRKKTVTA